ncbi:uncharacterized protein LOC135121495 [Zophobas morio]|uniref:uncharacterized protein LOC135121495 n=1 Tax=Zophobas morio TaxID=2755281 RepID=UPI0030830228
MNCSSCCFPALTTDVEVHSLEEASSPENLISLPLKKSRDYRSFVFIEHVDFGLLLLLAHKRNKGSHYQLPGGHIDTLEIQHFGLKRAALIAAIREVYEETGLSFSSSPKRLIFMAFPGSPDGSLKGRFYFRVSISDSDSVNSSTSPASCIKSASGENFYLRLSDEHVGFKFEKDYRVATNDIRKHSGGKNSQALCVYYGKLRMS